MFHVPAWAIRRDLPAPSIFDRSKIFIVLLVLSTVEDLVRICSLPFGSDVGCDREVRARLSSPRQVLSTPVKYMSGVSDLVVNCKGYIDECDELLWILPCIDGQRTCLRHTCDSIHLKMACLASRQQPLTPGAAKCSPPDMRCQKNMPLSTTCQAWSLSPPCRPVASSAAHLHGEATLFRDGGSRPRVISH